MGNCAFYGCTCRDNIYVCSDGEIWCSRHKPERQSYWQNEYYLARQPGSFDRIPRMRQCEVELMKLANARLYESMDMYEAELRQKAEAERLRLIAKVNEMLAEVKQQKRFEKENTAQAQRLISEAESCVQSGKHNDAKTLLEKRHRWTTEHGNSFDASLTDFDLQLEAALQREMESEAQRLRLIAREAEAEAERRRIINKANDLLKKAGDQKQFEKQNAEQARKLIVQAEAFVGSGKHREAIALLEKEYTWTIGRGKTFNTPLAEFDSHLESFLKNEVNDLLKKAGKQKRLEKENAEQARKLISEAESLTGMGKHQEAIELLKKKYTWTTKSGENFNSSLSKFDSCLREAKEAKAEKICALIGVIYGATFGIWICSGLSGFIILTTIYGVVLGLVGSLFGEGEENFIFNVIFGAIIEAIAGAVIGLIVGIFRGGIIDTIVLFAVASAIIGTVTSIAAHIIAKPIGKENDKT